MTKFRLYYDKDEEIRWLNEMCAQGYAMTGFCVGFFHFEKCEPGTYLYQTDLTQGLFRVSEDYRQFMTEAGVEIVCLWGPWVFLRRRAEEGPFELYTDAESSIEQYEKIRKMFKIVLAVEIVCFMMEVFGAAEGALVGIVFMLILGAFIVTISREILRINSVLRQLYERLGRPQKGVGGYGSRKPSIFLPIGLGFNALALCIQDSLGQTMRMILQIAAIAFMCLGIVLTCRGGGRDL